MSRTTVVVDGFPRTVNLIEPAVHGRIHQALVIAQLVDDLTGAPVRSAVRATTTYPRARTKVAADGIAGLVGRPESLFPDLATQPYDIDVAFEVEGFVKWETVVTLAIQPSFPGTFAAVDLGRVALHRRPVLLEVTTFALDPQSRPVGLGIVDVRVARIWRTVPDLSGAPGATPMLSIRSATAQGWPAGTGLDSVTLLPPPEPARRLLRGAAPGDRYLLVDRTGLLAAGDLAGIDLADLDRREWIRVAAVVGPIDPDSPARVDLTLPVQVAHAESTLVRRVPVPAAAPPDATLTEAAATGDATVFVGSTVAFGPVETVRATGLGVTAEFVTSQLYEITTDATGFGRMPPLTRAAGVEVVATKGPLTATAQVTLDYAMPVQRLQMTLR